MARRGRYGRSGTLGPIVPKSATNGHLLLRPTAGEQQFWQDVSCADHECPGYVHGFVLRIDERTDLGKTQAAYLRADRTRRGGEHRDELGLTVFTYPPGNPCTENGGRHKVPLEREPLYVLRNARGRQQVGPAQWTDTLHEATDRLAVLRAQG